MSSITIRFIFHIYFRLLITFLKDIRFCWGYTCIKHVFLYREHIPSLLLKFQDFLHRSLEYPYLVFLYFSLLIWKYLSNFLVVNYFCKNYYQLFLSRHFSKLVFCLFSLLFSSSLSFLSLHLLFLKSPVHHEAVAVPLVWPQTLLVLWEPLSLGNSRSSFEMTQLAIFGKVAKPPLFNFEDLHESLSVHRAQGTWHLIHVSKYLFLTRWRK